MDNNEVRQVLGMIQKWTVGEQLDFAKNLEGIIRSEQKVKFNKAYDITSKTIAGAVTNFITETESDLPIYFIDCNDGEKKFFIHNAVYNWEAKALELYTSDVF